MSITLSLLQILIGVAGGFAVGSGLVAFITVLDIIPRLAQLTNSQTFVRSYEWALVLGALFFTLIDFFEIVLQLPVAILIFIGLLAGVFIGTLAAGLTEVLNVFPILAKRLEMERYILFFLMAMVFGKVIGCIIQWIFQL
ncbi:stage V sporulation protein AB [Brevibacillus sp. SYSU BS000544]|uniref:stage V sporulation protein AB n=1 Tax=Brevibacillus sp. SYSU BS000544 TaxID=3416443 RepID=UPI003CE4A445